MKQNNSSGLPAAAIVVLCIGGLLVAGRVLPIISKILGILLGIVICITVLVVVLVLYFSLRKDKKPKEEARNTNQDKPAGNQPNPAQTVAPQSGSLEQMRILSKGRSHLMELQGMAMRIRDLNVQKRSRDICTEIEKILNALQKQPEEISGVRQFFNYYLPTLGNILLKYLRLEEGSAVREDTTVKVLSCLRDIQTAMERQHRAIYENDLLDLTVEMEALTLACKRDGLLVNEEFVLKDGSREITLTL